MICFQPWRPHFLYFLGFDVLWWGNDSMKECFSAIVANTAHNATGWCLIWVCVKIGAPNKRWCSFWFQPIPSKTPAHTHRHQGKVFCRSSFTFKPTSSWMVAGTHYETTRFGDVHVGGAGLVSIVSLIL